MSQPEAPKLVSVKHSLNGGAAEIPMLGFGTFKLEGKEATSAVSAAISAGFRHIDCARVYENEPEVGEAIEKAVSSEAVKRGDLFITSKLWNIDHAPEHVERACRQSIEDLRCGYLDLYLVHWPCSWVNIDPIIFWPQADERGECMQQNEDVTLEETWAAMEQLVAKGLVKAIGVCNCSTAQVDSILKVAKIKPAVNQVEVHAALPQTQLRKDMAERGILVEGYSPLGYGLADSDGIVDAPEIKAIAAEAGMTPARLLLSYVAALGVCLLTKSKTPSRIAENADLRAGQNVLSPAIMEKLAAFGVAKPRRTVNPDYFLSVPRTAFFSKA